VAGRGGSEGARGPVAAAAGAAAVVRGGTRVVAAWLGRRVLSWLRAVMAWRRRAFHHWCLHRVLQNRCRGAAEVQVNSVPQAGQVHCSVVMAGSPA
jgi:hypothetical protein